MLILAATRPAGCWKRVVDSIDLIQFVKLNLLIDLAILFEFLAVKSTCRGGASCPPSRDYAFHLGSLSSKYGNMRRRSIVLNSKLQIPLYL